MEEIISLIEGHIEKLTHDWQKAVMDGARSERNELNAQIVIVQYLLDEINDRKESTHVTEEPRTHLSTC
jgi:hypothetical protein